LPAQTAASCFAAAAGAAYELLLPAAACLRLRASTMDTAISITPDLQQRQQKQQQKHKGKVVNRAASGARKTM
jgi:hypothetical protein